MTSTDTAPAQPAPTERPRRRGRRAWAGRMFVAPNLAAVTVFMLFPLGFSLYMSFQQWDVFRPAKFVGLKNFGELFTSDPLFLIALRNIGGLYRRDRRCRPSSSASSSPVC